MVRGAHRIAVQERHTLADPEGRHIVGEGCHGVRRKARQLVLHTEAGNAAVAEQEGLRTARAVRLHITCVGNKVDTEKDFGH